MAVNSSQTVVSYMENGDHLTKAEFEHFYNLMPDLKKAELIEGVVYMPSPVRTKSHAEPHAHLIMWLGTYKAGRPEVLLADNATVRLDNDNVIQPDALLRLPEECGGKSRISEDDYIEGAPELIAEVTNSSASYDLHNKMEVCRRNGVSEYLVWLVKVNEFRWHVLTDGKYKRLQPDIRGIISSTVFPGLRLDTQAMLTGEISRVIQVVHHGDGSTDATDHRG